MAHQFNKKVQTQVKLQIEAGSKATPAPPVGSGAGPGPGQHHGVLQSSFKRRRTAEQGKWRV